MQRERKMKLNKHYSELNESYLFSTIAHKVAAYQKANPDKDIIRLGIGDVTLPLAKSVTDARSEERRVGKECRSRWSPYH